MKKGYKKLLIICLTLISLLALNISFNILNKYTYILFLIVSFALLVYLIGIEKDKYIFKKDILLSIIISCLFYFLITYTMGLFVGFLKNGYKLNVISIMKNTIPIIIIIILQELIRYNLVKKGSRKKEFLILTTIILILMDITLTIKGFDLKNSYLLMEFGISYFLPSVFKNALLTYTAHKGGYKPTIAYRLIMELPLYFMPIFPNLGIYMDGVLKILFPTLLIYIIYKLTNSNETQNNTKMLHLNNIFTIILIFIMFLMIGINVGWFKYYSLTIASGSMSPNINIGDIIIVEKINKNKISKINIGEILVYNKGNKIIVHRVIEIEELDNKFYFYTQGDANESPDNWVIEESDIIGTVKYRIKYIGYPTVLLSEYIEQIK